MNTDLCKTIEMPEFTLVPDALIKTAGLTCFLLAMVHTFSVKLFHKISRKFKKGSILENTFQLLGEVEVVFGLWSAILLGVVALSQGSETAIGYLESRDFKEPVFVFVILVVCASKPILTLAERIIDAAADLLPLKKGVSRFFVALTLGPLLGSLITEPAAMTVVAFYLLENFFKKELSHRFKYAILGVLFVNISIGGVLTPFAAPPVLMVASKWGWGFSEMFFKFGLRGILATAISAFWITYKFRRELKPITFQNTKALSGIPLWIQMVHVLFLVLVVLSAHHMVLVISLFLAYLGVLSVTGEYQTPPRLKEGLLVGFFLAGLIVLGGVQNWWLEPILSKLSSVSLYLSAIALTAVTDNAALTYLGSLVTHLTEVSKYALVAGAVVGGGLTVIANAPNPAGYSILQSEFGKDGISPIQLFISALGPTLVAAICFWNFF